MVEDIYRIICLFSGEMIWSEDMNLISSFPICNILLPESLFFNLLCLHFYYYYLQISAEILTVPIYYYVLRFSQSIEQFMLRFLLSISINNTRKIVITNRSISTSMLEMSQQYGYINDINNFYQDTIRPISQ